MDTQDLQKLKNKYDIIGNDPALNRALEMAVAVAPTDLTVLVTGESGVGKDNIPKIIHQFSRRKNAKYFAVNCGAIHPCRFVESKQDRCARHSRYQCQSDVCRLTGEVQS